MDGKFTYPPDPYSKNFFELEKTFDRNLLLLQIFSGKN